MAHWEHREEAGWNKFRFNQPYARGLERLKTEVLGKTDFDPATLWQWGTMQAMAVIGILKACERAFGAEGQKVVYEALRQVGHDVGRQILEGTARPEGISDAEYVSYYATVVNRIAYASLEDPRIDGAGEASFHIRWCPHQDTYQAFDCRVQRYFVQGMIEAFEEHVGGISFDVRFNCTIPAGAESCHFTMWRSEPGGDRAWAEFTRKLDAKALDLSPQEPRGKEEA